MDAAVFVLTADPPVSASERDLLGRVAGLSVATFAVLNKADHLDEAGLAEAVEFTRRVLGEAGHHGTVYPMSARAALGGRDDGFAAFGADFTAYLSARRETDLRASAVAQGRRIAGSLLDEVRLTRRAAEMRAGDAAQRVEQFTARLSEVTVHSRDALIVVDGESARLLFALNDAADEDGPRLGREITGQLEAVFDGELRDATAAEIERRGREQLAALAVAAAESWRAAAHRSHRAGAGRGRRPAGRGPGGRARRAPRLRLRAARPGSRGPGAGRPADREPTVLLHRRPGCRPDRAAGRCRPPLAPRRVRQADSQGAPAPCGPGPGRQPGRPGPRRPAVPAGRGDAGAAAGGRAAVCRRHGPDTVRAAGRGRAPGSVGGRGGGEGKRTGRTGGCASSRHGPARPGCRRQAASVPSAVPMPRGPTVLTLYSAADLLTGPGCPVCRYAAEAGDRYLAWFALEAHADAVTITRLCSSLGMRPRHTREVMSQPGAPSRLTAVYRYVLQTARAGRAATRHALRSAPRASTTMAPPAGRWTPCSRA